MDLEFELVAFLPYTIKEKLRNYVRPQDMFRHVEAVLKPRHDDYILSSSSSPSSSFSSDAQRPVLISLDLEYNKPSNDIYQVGIAMLDLAALSYSSTADDVISGRHFMVDRAHLPIKCYTRPYLFGQTESTPDSRESVRELLISILTPVDAAGRARDVVLVGHSIGADIRVIEKTCHFYVRSHPSVKAIVDTSCMASQVFDHRIRRRQPDGERRCRKFERACSVSLKETCALLQMPARKLHNAGNDAMYTLKALVLLFCRYKRQKLLIRDRCVTTPLREKCGRWEWDLHLRNLEMVVDGVEAAPPPLDCEISINEDQDGGGEEAAPSLDWKISINGDQDGGGRKEAAPLPCLDWEIACKNVTGDQGRGGEGEEEEQEKQEVVTTSTVDVAAVRKSSGQTKEWEPWMDLRGFNFWQGGQTSTGPAGEENVRSG